MTDTARTAPSSHHHAVRFYDNDMSLAQIVAQFLAEGLAAGDPAIVIATPAQRAGILKELVASSVDVVRLQRQDDLVLLDAQETLSLFMRNAEPDLDAFTTSMCQVINRACRGRTDCTVRIYGQMVDVLWQAEQRTAAIRLEMFWNQLANTHAFSLLCGYAMGSFYKDANFHEVCRQHTHVVSADGTRVSADDDTAAA
jgi:hypothetical protein